MGNITKTLKIFQQAFIVLTVVYILLIQPTASRPDDNNLSVCKAFTRNKEIKKRIETRQRHAPPCACAEQQMTLDSSFQKIDRCYVQWFFEYGVKQKCCYNEIGELQLGVPGGGYLLLEEINMSYIKGSCCSNTETCHVFYEINQSHNCSSYSPLQTVTSWGDPTIQTVDGAEYDFNGHGEYVFLKTSRLEIQARTDYVTSTNKDATVFSAFALFDKPSGEQIEFHHNKTAEDIIIYRNGTKYCNAKRDGINRPQPCRNPPNPNYKCFILAGAGIVLVQRCGVGVFASNIQISTAGQFMKLTITKSQTTDIEPMNISGLAGKLQNGNLLGRHGSQVDINATAYAIYNLSETWALQNENESLFFYNITGGNYTVYNGQHTVPRFLETLVGNLTELFKTFSPENITLFNKTCRNYWNSEPNKQCLLTIARTKDFSIGLDVMTEVNETRRKWEILNNEAPKFLDGMPKNITVIFKKDLYWALDLKEYASDDADTALTYSIQTGLPKEEYSLDNGVFNWTIGTGLRHIDTHFIFLATDRFNTTASREVSIQYCGCNEPVECKFDVSHSIATGKLIQKATCECLKYYEGDFCEKFTNPCENSSLECYSGLCNATVPKADPSDKTWPCSPCPKGRHENFIGDKQNCEDIDECATTEHICHQGCDNTNGSYRCTCEKGYDLDSDGSHCSDINECIDNGLCSQTEVCVNTIGSYTCNCAPGSMRHEETSTCVPIVAKTYVSTISFSVVITQGFDKEMIDTEENRNNIQKKLQERYENSTGFIGVQVVKLSITILISGNSARRKRANEEGTLDAQYILYWKNLTNTTTIQKALENTDSMDSTDSLLEADGVITGLFLTSVANLSVNTDICSIPGQHDCDHLSTECVNLEGGYKCKCLAGYVYAEYSKKYCTEINECDLFVKANSTEDRCVHGSCVNVPGSWNCTCPKDRLWQSVGNDSVSVYRCQGNYSYIGTIRFHLMFATSSEEEIVAFVKDQLSVTFGNKSLHEEANYDIHISSIFVHATVLTIEEDKSASNYTHGSYDIMFTLRLGEIVDTDRLISVMKILSGRRNLHINNRSDVYVKDFRIFNDSENILCNLTSYGDCDEATTYCQQRNGTTHCVCKSGFEKRSEADKFCRDINECTNTTYNCLGGRCDNYPGNWSCTCNEKSFVPVRVDDYTLNCTEVHFNACNSYPNFECRNGNRSCINDRWTCNCRKGALAVAETDVLYICEDEDECVIRNNTCSSHGKCKNHANGFTCDCDEGYGRNDSDPFNVTCIDIDECQSPDYSCVNGFCGNTVGNWTCSCNETGFVRKQVTPNAIVCEDIDECKNEHFFCGGECTNSFGSWTCDCTAGFTKYTNNDQITCEDINECDRKDACIDSACKNLDGSWTCLCQDGKEPKKINDSTIACTG
ncbi:uncharacterized protein LOC123543072 [Mercenaria mercenaria]|uniref:uncharacterized protein LOC123543072 n=1 Tax=Mercenaria mercenaria TaxID=6596 RepID=UPI00234ED9B3|nr:uncharacterized protein LOC123543072 [Mercenaria mercenaria]